MQKVLVLSANPQATDKLRLDQEFREIDEGLKRARYRDQFDLTSKWAVRERDFYRYMLEIQPQIVHFTGHGAAEEGIVLEDEAGKPFFLPTEQLAGLFKLFASKGVECVVLNSCFSQVQAKAINEHIPYVIGMNRAIGDRAAIKFAVAFYDALGAGEEVKFAFDLGCIQLIGLKEHETPVLLEKPGTAPTLKPDLKPEQAAAPNASSSAQSNVNANLNFRDNEGQIVIGNHNAVNHQS